MPKKYSADLLATLDPQVRALALEQQADDKYSILDDRERFNRERTMSISGVSSDDLTKATAVPDNTQAMFEDDEEERVARKNDWVTAALEKEPQHLRDAYDAIYVQRLTIRDAAHRLGISGPALLGRLGTLHRHIALAKPVEEESA